MKRILIIEDNAEIRDNTSEILTLAGYIALTAHNGKIGVDVALKEKPDLILCDIMMPELDGYGVLHILSKKPETAEIPFIFLTAKTEKSDVRKGMELGADDYLTKPFGDTELLNAVETRLRKHEIRRKHYTDSSAGLDSFLDDAGKVLQAKDLCKDKKIRSYAKKATIYTEGDKPSSVFLIEAGEVKAFKFHPDGKELITDLYKKGDFFGFEPILEDRDYGDSATALQDCNLVVIPRSDFLTLLYSQRDVAASFISLLSRKVAAKEAQLLNLAYSSVRQRTAEALLKTSKLKDGDNKIYMSREDLAKIVGTATESVIRVLSEFKDEGLIEIEGGKVRILDASKLEKVVRWNVAR
jgi:DNA-binding response OmpR family regulator